MQTKTSKPILICLLLSSLVIGTNYLSARPQTNGWLNWRGPNQNGTSAEENLIDTLKVNGQNHRWSYPLSGRGTPVIAGKRLYAFGYDGEGVELREVLVCIDTQSGKKLWVRYFRDFISDIIYNRYSIGSPAIDSETGNVYLQTSPGLALALDADGKHLWQHSMMEEFGRLTFPNGRTGSPVVDGNLVIFRGITTNWGKQGPARDRFYAFDKYSGKLVWSSTPGVRPTDSSFSTPIFGWLGNIRVFYAGTGCGNVVCVNAKNGRPLSRFQFLHGGVNSSLLVYQENTIIAIHGKENIDTSEIGRMAAIKMDRIPGLEDKSPIVIEKDVELWRNNLGIFTSSPVLVENRIYQVTHTGNLGCVDADSGTILWEKKLSNSQLHASSLYADGKLYIPMVNGLFYILKPSDTGATILAKVQLEGNCLGAPAVWDGKIYVHTTEKLYCFGEKEDLESRRVQISKRTKQIKAGKIARIIPIPSEVLLRPGESKNIEFRMTDEHGHKIDGATLSELDWQKYVPPKAKVKSYLNADIDNTNTFRADHKNVPSAGMFKISDKDVSGLLRGRILPGIPFSENFQSVELNVPHKLEENVKFAFPPLPWIGARFKWEIRDLNGNNVLTKTLDRVLFQRTMTFIGTPDSNNYIMQADVMSDGNRRIMSTVGIINQRYLIALKGNWQQLEVSSNHDRLKVAVPFTWKPNVWYTIKSRIDIDAKGNGIIRGKAWQHDAPEPEQWTIEVPHTDAHTHGAPGLFGFSPQSKKRVYIDNIVLTNLN